MPAEEGHEFAQLRDQLGELLLVDESTRRRQLDDLHKRDPRRAAQLHDWLAEADEAGDFLGDALPVNSSPSPVLAPGSRVDHFTIERVLGLGGSSVVYAARQDSPRRTVALKLLQTAWLTPDHLRRFTREADLLAQLDHPSIAQVFQVGSVRIGADEVPYIAMELVDGARSLTRYADGQHLEIRERVRLLTEVCTAIAHAHEHGVIHRDLKPDNLLVDARDQLRVIDFGIGKSEHSTLHTHTGDRLGTASYMSPEQDRGATDASTPASDVYALGALLVELTCGQLPTRKPTAGSPLRLPERFLAVADRDLRAIAHQALHEDPRRRYPDAAELTADLTRWLSTRPVHAREPGNGQRFLFWVRRNRLMVTAAVAGLAMIFAILVGWAVDASSAAERERLRRQEAERVTQFLQSMLEQTSPRGSGSGVQTIRQLLQSAALRVDDHLRPGSFANAEVHATIARAFLDQGEVDAAVDHFETAVAAFDRHADQNPLTPAFARNALGDAYLAAGRDADAAGVLEQALQQLRVHAASPVAVAMSQSKLARALGGSHHSERAIALAETALATYQRHCPPTSHAAAAGHFHLAHVLLEAGDLARATDHASEAVAIDEALHGEDSIEAARSRVLSASILNQLADERAGAVAERALRVLHPLVTSTDPDLRRAQKILADEVRTDT